MNLRVPYALVAGALGTTPAFAAFSLGQPLRTSAAGRAEDVDSRPDCVEFSVSELPRRITPRVGLSGISPDPRRPSSVPSSESIDSCAEALGDGEPLLDVAIFIIATSPSDF